MYAETPSSRFTPSVSDAAENERRSLLPIPDAKRTTASLGRPSEAAPPLFHYPPEWDGVVWFGRPDQGRSFRAILAEVMTRGVRIAALALVVACLLSVALGVGADAAALAGAAR